MQGWKCITLCLCEDKNAFACLPYIQSHGQALGWLCCRTRSTGIFIIKTSHPGTCIANKTASIASRKLFHVFTATFDAFPIETSQVECRKYLLWWTNQWLVEWLWFSIEFSVNLSYLSMLLLHMVEWNVSGESERIACMCPPQTQIKHHFEIKVCITVVCTIVYVIALTSWQVFLTNQHWLLLPLSWGIHNKQDSTYFDFIITGIMT